MNSKKAESREIKGSKTEGKELKIKPTKESLKTTVKREVKATGVDSSEEKGGSVKGRGEKPASLGLALPIKKNKETVKRLLEVGMHFGHRTSRWNPKMAPFIFGERNGIHIIDVTKTVDMLIKACEFLQAASRLGEIVFVSTKKQANDIIVSAAKRAGAYFVINRWPGGLLTNLPVIKNSIERLNFIEKQLLEGIENRTKKELILMKRELQRLYRLYGGLRGFKRFPKAVVLIDPKKERLVLREAKKVGVPVVALVDTNSDPSIIDYPVPGNDDSIRSIKLFVDTIANAVLMGNRGRGVVHKELDLAQIDLAIQTMAERISKKREERAKAEPTKVVKVGGRWVKIIKKAET